jgi:hypothetical protein
LTKEKPTFTNNCKDFKKDFNEIEKARKGNGAYRKVGDENTHYIFPYLPKDKKNQNETEILKLQNKVFKSIEFRTIIIVAIFGVPLIIGFFNLGLDIMIITSVSILIISSLYLHKKFKETHVLIIDKKGFLVKPNQYVEWDNMIRYYFRSFTDVNNTAPILTKTSKTLIIEVYGKSENIQVDITGCGGNLSKLGNKIEIIKNYAQHAVYFTPHFSAD